MKKLNLFIAIVSILSISLTSCLKDPGNPVLTASKSTVAVNEEVTFTLSGVENYTCIFWNIIGNNTIPDYEVVSGGCGTCSPPDKTITVKFTSAGTVECATRVKNCTKGCVGKCRDESAMTNIIVQ
jgi:hypothetical protein